MDDSAECRIEIDPKRQQWLNTVLEKLQKVKEPFLINVLTSIREPQDSMVLYHIKIDVVAASLEERTNERIAGERPEPTAHELGNVAYAYTRAMATAQELVSTMQELQVATIDPAAIYVTEKEEVRVNLLQAALVPGAQDVVTVLFRAAFGRDMNSAEEAGLLLEKVSPDRRELVEALIDGNRDYATLARGLPVFECQFCHNLKPAPSVPLCPQHFFCSETCFNSLKQSTNTVEHRCPICPVKPKVRTFLKPKEESKASVGQACASCGKLFTRSDEDSWRLELIGTTGYTSSSVYCSQGCYQSQFPPPRQQTTSCVMCRQPTPETGVVLHCEQHGLCSQQCRRDYYRGEDLAAHSLSGALICYECLEAYLQEVGPAGDSPEVQQLVEKVRAFRTRLEDPQKPPSAGEVWRMVVDCGKYISPSALRYALYRTVCLFCEKPILVQKAINEDFILNDVSPLLVACDFRLHGVCSRKCVRDSIPRYESSRPLTIRCPQCPSSLLTSESLSLALDSRNPTQEVVRRTPLTTCSSVQCKTHYNLPGCRHEICGKWMNLCVDGEGMVGCIICGFKCSFDKTMETMFEVVTKCEVKGRDYDVS